MHNPQTGRLIGSLTGCVSLFAISSAAAGDFLPFIYFLGIVGIALIVLLAIVGGGWAGVKIQSFLTGRAFDLAFARVAPSHSPTQMLDLPVPQDPFTENRV